MFKVFYCIFGVSIIPKWLINDSLSIAILFRWFLELWKFCQNLDPHTSQLLPKYFKQYQKNMESSLKPNIFISVNLKFEIFRVFERHAHHFEKSFWSFRNLLFWNIFWVCISQNIFCGDEDRKMIHFHKKHLQKLEYEINI